jgi:hypothetical protein
MNDYFAFGGCLRSELDFPDLSRRPPSGRPDWELRISPSAHTAEPGDLRGEREVGPGWVLRLFRLQEGWRLDYGATGSYLVLDGGRRIVWHQGSDRREEVVRAVILGPIMALALHEAGILCLHGSAVALKQGGVGFLASKGYGKSSLAVAITAAGGRLMSDDLLAVTPTAAPEILPGVHSVRMHDDVTELIAHAFPESLLRAGWKKTLTNFPAHRLGWEREPLCALYVLSPVHEPRLDRVSRSRVESMEAALSLATHNKITDLLGNIEAGRMLPWIGAIVSKVPVYRLEVPRDLKRLPEVASDILSWHDGAREARS